MLLVGSDRPFALDSAAVAARFEPGETSRALAEVGIESPAAALATFVTDRRGLERYVGDALPVTDDRPRVEHGAWVRRGELQRVLPHLLDLASDLPLRPEDPLRPSIQAERAELHAFYRAALLQMGGRREEASRALAAPMARDPGNPYYRWVIRGG
jgi:spermidine synthase